MQPTYSQLEISNQQTFSLPSLKETSFALTKSHEEEDFLEPSQHLGDQFLKELSENLFYESPLINQDGYVIDEQLKFQTFALDERFEQVTARIQELLQTEITTQQGSFSLAHIFQTTYYEQIASAASQDSAFYFVGSFLRHLMDLCAKTVLQQWNLKGNAKKFSQISYNDIDFLIQLKGSLAEQTSILHTNLKQRFKQSTAVHGLKTPIDKCFPPQYFDICYTEEGCPDRSFDICLSTAHSRIGLSFFTQCCSQMGLSLSNLPMGEFKASSLTSLYRFRSRQFKFTRFKRG